MSVKQTVQSIEEKSEEAQSVEQAQNKLIGDLLSSLDLPSDEEKPKDKKEERKPVPKAEPKEDAEEETEDPEESEDTEDKSEEDADETDDEVVPKSKHEKALKHMQKRLDSLTAKVKQYEAKPAVEPTSDPDKARLEKMSDNELKDLKRKVRVAQARETDDTKLDQLVELELKIDEVSSNAPKRFEAAQLAAYNAKAEEIALDPEIEDINKAAPEIKAIAQRIYAQYPRLQRTEDGQAMALELAANHYKEIHKVSAGKEKVNELKRQNTSLKRKTGLDSPSHKGGAERANNKKLEARAYGSQSTYDKVEFISQDPRFNVDALIPEEFKGR